jgi:predicted phage terminase large subunit-like protein
VWLLLSGRGFGKTLAGASWVNKLAVENAGWRLALVGRTASDVRDVMVDGATGIRSVNKSVTYEPSKRRLTWPNGSTATTFTADQPDMLRGPQFHAAWCDELASWRYRMAWDNLSLGLRLGDRPRVCVTTTPRPIKLIRELMKDEHTVNVTGTTYENLDNLAPSFRKQVLERYEGTRLGRQELYAEILDDVPGALWNRDTLEQCRVDKAPALSQIVVAIDPAVTAGEDSDETGIVVCGLGEDGHGYVLQDLSGRYTPEQWARRAVEAYNMHEANWIVAEVNNGGDLVERNIRLYRDGDLRLGERVSFRAVRAARGKYTRAEPIGNLYEQGRIHHVGVLPDLEDQQCTWVPGEASPDRVDALVWGMTELMLGQKLVLGVL